MSVYIPIGVVFKIWGFCFYTPSFAAVAAAAVMCDHGLSSALFSEC